MHRHGSLSNHYDKLSQEVARGWWIRAGLVEVPHLGGSNFRPISEKGRSSASLASRLPGEISVRLFWRWTRRHVIDDHRAVTAILGRAKPKKRLTMVRERGSIV